MSRHKTPTISTSELRETIAQLGAEANQLTLSPGRRRRLETEIRALAEELGRILRNLDPVAEQTVVVDPSNPNLVGRFVALALVAQPRCPLSSVPKTYGSGIYAIYYNGGLDWYEPISRTETPIYVGTASPAVPNARNPFEQGARLSERIAYHAGNIGKAATTLSLEDFEFRSLVVQSGWEKQAESYLINLFRPVWNKETRVVSGFGKHGDSAEMRQHGRSPWDTLHPARTWAGGSSSDQKPTEQIKAELFDHFRANPPYASEAEVLAEFFDELRQSV
jgi:hypothetical protein